MPRLAVVTGAAGGIGRATAAAFIKAGWEVIGLDQHSASDLPQGATFDQIDVSDSGQVEAFFGTLADSGSRLDALVNIAAIPLNKAFMDIEPEEWDRVQAVNLRSIFLMSKAAYPLLKPTQGAIVNVGSVHAIATSIHTSAYAASRGGMLALSRALAIEFGPEGVRVNTVLPGAVDTKMVRDSLSQGHLGAGTVEQRLKELSRRTLLGRMAVPEEIAPAILFLADSDRSSFITGYALKVDGGGTAGLSTE